MDRDIKINTGTPYVPETVDVFLLEEYIAMINGPLFVQNNREKYSINSTSQKDGPSDDYFN